MNGWLEAARLPVIGLIAAVACSFALANTHVSDQPFLQSFLRVASTSLAKHEKIGSVVWGSCGPSGSIRGVECGHITVPKDYYNSSAGVAKIALAKYSARLRPRKGTVFFNPGGPGGSGKNWIAAVDPHLIASVVGDEYDIIGFDPRGVGESVPHSDCFSHTAFGSHAAFARNTVIERGYDIAFNASFEEARRVALVKEAELDALLQTKFQICKEAMGDELRYMSTSTVVRDIDFMSKIFDGEDALINFYGLSYGSVLGMYLINMLPDRVGRVAIDGIESTLLWASEPAYRWHRQWYTSTDASYDLFFIECSRAGPSGCALALFEREDPNAIQSRLEVFINGLLYQPLSCSHAKIPGVLTTGRAQKFLLVGLYSPKAWPRLAQAFAEAMEGDASAILNANDAVVDRSVSRTAVTCNDQTHFKAPSLEAVVDERMYVHQNVSRFAFAAVNVENDDFGCQYWDVAPPPEKFQGPWNHTFRNPVLIASNTLDPVTPITSGRELEELLGASARLLVVNSPGHTSIALPSTCLKYHMNAFFANGTLPPKDTVCPVSEGPFPGLNREQEQERY